ncbi:MAG TPA: MarR family winged helix-turn-helix transcriptional regulator, partial [Acidimicrobiales bacterium]|nr:MarR family winged helix-turn-helix transcriptional regulator [Acidimicrobiales bacterium]
ARLSKRLEGALGDVDLSLPQYRLLVFLSRRAEVASGLAGGLAVSPPTVTTLVDGLVARALVERTPDADDRRRVRHELTPAGRRLLADADAALDERLRSLAANLPAAQARRALDALEFWHAALDAEFERVTSRS